MPNLAEISPEAFASTVLADTVPAVVDFWAPWCRPCIAVAPSLAKLADEFGERAHVYKVNVDAAPEIATQFGISSIPAFVVFRDGKEVGRHVGTLGALSKIREMVEQALSASPDPEVNGVSVG